MGRDMMRMVLELNRTRFNREAVVTCYTYHQASTRPERMAPLPPRDYLGEMLKPQPKRVLPSAQEVIAKYLSVVGANRQDILSQAIVTRGTVESVERAKGSGPTEIVFTQPNKPRITETLTSGVVSGDGTARHHEPSRALRQGSSGSKTLFENCLGFQVNLGGSSGIWLYELSARHDPVRCLVREACECFRETAMAKSLLARLTRQRGMLRTERFFKTFRGTYVAGCYISPSEFVTNRFDSHDASEIKSLPRHDNAGNFRATCPAPGAKCAEFQRHRPSHGRR